MVINYEDLYIDLDSKRIFGEITEREKKMFNKLKEWSFNDDINLDYELEDIDE